MYVCDEVQLYKIKTAMISIYHNMSRMNKEMKNYYFAQNIFLCKCKKIHIYTQILYTKIQIKGKLLFATLIMPLLFPQVPLTNHQPQLCLQVLVYMTPQNGCHPAMCCPLDQPGWPVCCLPTASWLERDLWRAMTSPFEGLSLWHTRSTGMGIFFKSSTDGAGSSNTTHTNSTR